MYVPPPAIPAVAAITVFTSFALLVVAARIFTRKVYVKHIWPEDYLIVATIAISIVFLVLVFFQVKNGLGRDITLDELSSFRAAVWATSPAYYLSLGFCKISIVIQCIRIFWFSTTRKILYGFLVILSIQTAWAVLSNFFGCIPPQAAWGAADGQCLDPQALGFANAGINFVSDICVLAIPIPQLAAMQLPRKQKIILIAVFTCGIL
ncbi:hypothetical protein BX600DRAFT_556234 [Xylariales sp. PMI_506]|nr:hypothetical protein BX600DRAFT_556234 [Xylariales sp. PMI_506]